MKSIILASALSVFSLAAVGAEGVGAGLGPHQREGTMALGMQPGIGIGTDAPPGTGAQTDIGPGMYIGAPPGAPIEEENADQQHQTKYSEY
jgi:hypothetical protein